MAVLKILYHSLPLFAGVWFGWVVVKAVRSGELRAIRPTRGGGSGPFTRTQNPALFWFYVVWGVCVSAIMIWMGVELLLGHQ